MKNILIAIFLLISVASFAQQGAATNTVFYSSVDGSPADTTNADFVAALATKVSQGYAYWFWNNQATTPHHDIYTDAGVEHVFTFAGSGGSGGSVNTLAPNIQTGDYTIQASDTTNIIYMRHVTNNQVVTIPSGLKVGSTFVIVRDSTNTGNTVTIQGASGVDLIGTDTLAVREVSVWHHRETGKYVRLGSSGTGAGLVDGDYGDITVGGTGTTMTIDNLAVTNAKVNDVAYSKLTSVPDAVADGATKGVASFTAADFNASSGNISIDYANGQAAGAAQNGFVNQSAQTFAGVKTFSSDPLVPDEAYDATAWNGSLEPPTKDAVRDKIETITAVDYTRQAVSVSAGTLTLDMNSATLRNFDLTSTQSSGFTIAFSNTTNMVEAKLTLRLTGSVSITMPSAVEMQNYETINARWNTSTQVLTLVGTTATRFLITFYYDGTVILTQASDHFE